MPRHDVDDDGSTEVILSFKRFRQTALVFKEVIETG
jgi:hypothetical protein